MKLSVGLQGLQVEWRWGLATLVFHQNEACLPIGYRLCWRPCIWYFGMHQPIVAAVGFATVGWMTYTITALAPKPPAVLTTSLAIDLSSCFAMSMKCSAPQSRTKCSLEPASIPMTRRAMPRLASFVLVSAAPPGQD